MSDREYEYFLLKDKQCNEFISKTPKSNFKNYSDISDKGWSVAGGLGTNRSLTLIGISKDFRFLSNYSFFITAGIGTALPGIGISFQNNVNNNGINLSVTLGASYTMYGLEPTIHSNLCYQWKFENNTFLSLGIMGGYFWVEDYDDYGDLDTIAYPYIFPTISYDFRF